MVSRGLLFLALALAGSSSALPTKQRRGAEAKPEQHEPLTVYDASVTEPTRMPAKIAYVERGTPVRTTTETVVVMPTPKDDETDCPETTVTAIRTRTATRPLEASPVLIGGEQGGPSVSHGPPQGLPRPPSLPMKPSSESKGKSPSGGSERFGISYAPYRADHGCKSAEDIEDDFRQFAKEYSVVRIYGTDCDQVPNVYKAAKAAGVKLMLGIWDIHDVENEASKIVAALDGDWDIVHSITVGNELVNAGQARPQEVVHAVRQARETLRSSGYEGPVVTVDTFIATEKHPELCEASDFCAINAHAFFDSTMRAEDAGKWLTNTVEQVQSRLSKPMHIVVTETGWPMDGASNGLAIPGLENQKLALESIREAFADRPRDVILFSAFNDLWKQRSMDTFNADQYWGIGGAISRCDL